MFLELSFDSQAEDKQKSVAKSATTWRYDRQDKHEMSLDELISDFHQSASERQLKVNQSVSKSKTLPLPTSPFVKYSKRIDGGQKSFESSGRAHAVQRKLQTKNTRPSTNKTQYDDSSDDDVAISPMPRLERVLQNRSSLRRKQCGPAATRNASPNQQHKRDFKPSIPSSPSLTPLSLSPMTTPSAASSLLSVSQDIDRSGTSKEDSVDALIGKDIRELNKLIRSGRQNPRTRTSTAISDVRKNAESKSLRSPLRMAISRHKSRLARPESPPPPPPPEDDLDGKSEDEEDSFAEEIRKLRASHRISVMPAKEPDKETLDDDPTLESSDMCAAVALKIRYASNTINGLLLEAMKPFEDRQREEEMAHIVEGETTGTDSAIPDAMTAELQAATQTIVSQLDVTFAEMTRRQERDLKAEAEAKATLKELEKRDKEAVDEKKMMEEKKVKEHEMEILRMVPMQGKLLTCSTDIECLLDQFDCSDTRDENQSIAGASAIETSIKTLQAHMQHKIQAIESRLSAPSSDSAKSSQGDHVSWRAVDWMHDNFSVDHLPLPAQNDSQQPEDSEDCNAKVAHVECEERFEDILQRQVLEKLDLTMLKLKHILAIDTKEAADILEKQQQEKEEQERKQMQQRLEDEEKQREREDAEHAKQRVMGLTAVDDVEGWASGTEDESKRDRSLSSLMISPENRLHLPNDGNKLTKLRGFSSSLEEAMHEFDRFGSARKAGKSTEDSYEVVCGCGQDRGEPRKLRWAQVGDSEDDSDRIRDDDSDSDESSRRRSNHRSSQGNKALSRSSQCAPIDSRARRALPSFEKRRELCRQRDIYSVDKRKRGGRFASETKEYRGKHEAGDHQQQVTRVIEALQAERRQKTAWIRS